MRKFVLIFTATLLGAAPAAFADGGALHKPEQTRPTQLGVSGSSIEFVLSKNRLFCYTGTLGSLITDGINQYVLSNNHVLAKENNPDLSGTTLLDGRDGYNIIQPGLLDEGSCTTSRGDPDNIVAVLTDYVVLEFGKKNNPPLNTVDAAMAEVRSGKVDPNGDIMDVGTLAGSEPAAIGMKVQKSGRTTGHTVGTVQAVNVTIDVAYDSGTARFEDQISIRGDCDSNFSAGGDSGSLIVNVPNYDIDVSNNYPNRNAVGLLYAGGGSLTFANQIADVLAELGNLSMVTHSGGTNANDTARIPICEPDDDGGGGGGPPGGNGPPGRNKGDVDPVGLDIAADVKARHGDELFAIPGVVGHGVGVDENGDAVITVYVDRAGRPIPDQLEGISVNVIETGIIRAY